MADQERKPERASDDPVDDDAVRNDDELDPADADDADEVVDAEDADTPPADDDGDGVDPSDIDDPDAEELTESQPYGEGVDIDREQLDEAEAEVAEYDEFDLDDDADDDLDDDLEDDNPDAAEVESDSVDDGPVSRRPVRKELEATDESAGRGGPVAFVKESVVELRKVVWPTAGELRHYFVGVLVFVVFIIALVSSLDFGLGILLLDLLG